jgi:hypothetical protein
MSREEQNARDQLARERGGYGPGWYAIYYRSGKTWRSPKGFEGPYNTKADAESAKRALKGWPRIEVAKLPNDPFTLEEKGSLPRHLKVSSASA